jgi:nitroreductase
MEVSDALNHRRMTRAYRPEPVPREVLARVAGAIRHAPSGGFSQGQRLVVVTDDEARRAVAGLYPDAWPASAPALIVVAVREEDYHERYREPDKVDDEGREIDWPIPYWWVDAGALLALVQLAAIEEGLGTGFFGVADPRALAEVVGLPADTVPIGVVAVGYPADAGEPPSSRTASRRKPLDQLVRWI